MMLRGPQTIGELKGRTERLHRFADLGAVHETLERLASRELVEQLARRPGEKGERWRQQVGGEGTGEAGTEGEQGESLADRVARLEREVAELREAVRAVRKLE
jgi:uncharacterized protein YceH (UPF0502 family)